MDALWKSFSTTRQGCFLDSGLAVNVDASLTCHELRCVPLAPGETGCFSCRVAGAPIAPRERLALVGEVLQLKGLKLDSTIVVRVWAASAERPGGEIPERRSCGEVRVPLARLASKYGACLYQTWLPLESDDLNASVASFTSLRSGDEDEALDRSIRLGHVNQAKVCLSLLRTEDLAGSGRMAWATEDDVPPTERSRLWGALLLSQQQHALMCRAQFLQQQADVRLLEVTTGNGGSGKRCIQESGGCYGSQGPAASQDLQGEQHPLLEETLRSQLRWEMKAKEQSEELQASQRSHADVEKTLSRLRSELREEELREGGAADCREALAAENKRLTTLLADRTRVEAQNTERLRQHLNLTQKASGDALRVSMLDLDAHRVEAESLRRRQSSLVDECSEAMARARSLEHLAHERALELAKQQEKLRTVQANLKVQEARAERLSGASKEEAGRLALENERLLALLRAHDAERSQQRDNFERLESKCSEQAMEKLRTLQDSLMAKETRAERLICASKEEAGRAVLENERLLALLRANDSERSQQGDTMERLERKCAEQAKELDSLQRQRECHLDELSLLRKELDFICEEGSTRMGAASAQVRDLRQRYETAMKEVERLSAETIRLAGLVTDVEAERDAVVEQKDALAQIVEDLHTSCVDNGLMVDSARMPIDGLRGRGSLGRKDIY